MQYYAITPPYMLPPFIVTNIYASHFHCRRPGASRYERLLSRHYATLDVMLWLRCHTCWLLMPQCHTISPLHAVRLFTILICRRFSITPHIFTPFICHLIDATPYYASLLLLMPYFSPPLLTPFCHYFLWLSLFNIRLLAAAALIIFIEASCRFAGWHTTSDAILRRLPRHTRRLRCRAFHVTSLYCLYTPITLPSYAAIVIRYVIDRHFRWDTLSAAAASMPYLRHIDIVW